MVKRVTKKNGFNIMLFVFKIIPKIFFKTKALTTGFSADGYLAPAGLLLRARDAKIPRTDSPENITKPVLMAEISPG